MAVSDARKKDDRVVRGLRLKLWLALALLGVLAAGSYLLFEAQSGAIASSAGVINICGRQRMLSQRAALLIGRLEVAGDEAERRRLRSELLEIADTMESHARRLLGGGPALAPPPVRTLMLDSPHDLSGSLRRFIDGVRAAADPASTDAAEVDPRVAAAVSAARDGTILAALDHVVDVMQRHSEASVGRLRRAQLTATALFLVTLVLLVALVYRPVLRDLRLHLTERRRSHKALREQRRQLRLNFDHAPLGIARCSVEGRLLTVNPALCRVLGLPADVLVGRAIEELAHPDDYLRLVDALRRPASGGRSHDTTTLRLRHRDGSWITGVVHWSLVTDDDGSAIGWIAHFEDRSRQLAAEEQARQDRERLAQMARLHTLGEMAAGIAHEVNQPLTAISNYARAGRRMLESGVSDPDAIEVTLDKVSAQALRAGEVIRGLREFVRRRQSRAERVDLDALVRDAVALALTDAHFLSVGVETDLAAGPARVHVDPVQIQQVILNLIRNAIEALDPAVPGAPVVVRTSGDGDGFVEVTVEDHGVGIPETARSQLFDPFFTSKESGLGMGLAISRSIVTSHGGRIWCTSGGEGTTFHFTLPTAGAYVETETV